MGSVGTVEDMDGRVYAVEMEMEMEAERVLHVAGPLREHIEKRQSRDFTYSEISLRRYLDKRDHFFVRLEDFCAKPGSFLPPMTFQFH